MRIRTRASGALSSLLILSAAIIFFLITGCATHMRQSSDGRAIDNARREQTSAPNVPLFVHLMTPRYYTDPRIPPKRIATTRISIEEDFAVSFGDSGPSHSYSVGGLDPYNYSGDAVLAGRIEQRGAKLFAHLLGVSRSTVNTFAGELEIEKPVASQGALFSGAIWSVRFVLSTNFDCSLFLKE
jgi:hypothetical protein